MQKKSKFNVFAFMMLIILSLTFQPAISTYAACPDGISSYWKLDGTAGPPYTDFISDNDGSTGATTEPTAVTGIVNGAQQFDSTADTKLDVSPDSSFGWYKDESFSIEFWIKRDGGIAPGGSNEVAIGRDDPAGLQWWVGIRGNDFNTARFLLRNKDGSDIATVTGNKNITDNEWHHVVAIRDAGNGQNLLYVDGKLDGSDLSPPTYDPGFDSTTADLNIGYLNLFPFFRLNGFLDEIALYNKALTATEILQHYTDGLKGQDYCLGSNPFVPFPDDTISLWNLDEGPNPPNDTYEDSFDGNDGSTGATTEPTAVTGIVNGAQQFDSTADTKLDVPPDSSFGWYKDESFSIEFWIKRDGGIAPGGSNEVAIGRDDPAGLQWWVGIRGDDFNTVRFLLRNKDGSDIATVTGNKNITDNEWHHVVAVRDAGNGQNLLYVDGKLDGSDLSPPTYDPGFDSTTAELTIGYLNLFPFFRLNGFLDEVALFNKALTLEEIEEHYNSGNDDGEGIADSRPAPVAAADATPTNPQEATVVTLDSIGSAAGYAAAPITTYLWEQTDGTPVINFTGTSTETATFEAPDFVAAGQPLTFQLTVTASDGQSDTTTVDVDVVDNPPVAKAGPDQNVNEGDPVALDGSSSTGTGIKFSWTQTDGTPAVNFAGTSTATPTFTAPQVDADEILTFELTVTDNNSLTSTDEVAVNVADASGPLQANAGADQTVAPGATVTLDGSGSTGTNPTYKWAQTAGTPVQLAGDDTATPTFTAPTAADISAAVLDTLMFQLTVTDASGSNTDTVDVIVDDSVGRSSGGGGGGGGCFINSMFYK